METLLAGVPSRNVHRVPTELGPEAAARAYADEIRTFFDGFPRFDVIHLGLGENAHTASLFPGDPLVDDREGIAAAARVDAEPPWRVTLLPGVLAAARQRVFFVTGAGKAEAVRAVLNGPYDPRRYPAQLARDAEWFLDRAAAA
jgi:6-phosphogluconolactonase